MDFAKIVDLIRSKEANVEDLYVYNQLLLCHFDSLRKGVLEYYDSVLSCFVDNDGGYKYYDMVSYYYMNGIKYAQNEVVSKFSDESYESEIERIGESNFFKEIFEKMKNLFYQFVKISDSEIVQKESESDYEKQFDDLLDSISSEKAEAEKIFKDENSLKEFVTKRKTAIKEMQRGNNEAMCLEDVKEFALFLIANDIVDKSFNFKEEEIVSKLFDWFAYISGSGLTSFGATKSSLVQLVEKFKNDKENSSDEILCKLSSEERIKKIEEMIELVSVGENQKNYFLNWLRQREKNFLNVDVGIFVNNVLCLYYYLLCANDVIAIFAGETGIDYSKINFNLILEFFQRRDGILKYGCSEEKLRDMQKKYLESNIEDSNRRKK